MNFVLFFLKDRIYFVLLPQERAFFVHRKQSCLQNLANAKNDVKIIGTRHGEKLYETLCTREEMIKAQDMGDFYRIPADNRDLNYSMYFSEGEKSMTEVEDYHSHNTERLDIDQVKKLISTLAIVRKELFAEEVDEFFV